MLDKANPTTEAPEAEDEPSGLSRRGALTCMVWAGTGVLWTLSGGVPKSLGLIGDALAAEASAFTFLQISGLRPHPALDRLCRLGLGHR